MADLASQAGATRINLAEEPDFDVGGLRVLPAERAVELNGERKELQPRVMQVLVALARARPAVVSRDRLVEQCWDGRIVGDDALNRCILALRHLAQEFSPVPFTIETVPRVGHRLVETGSKLEPAQAARAPLLRFNRPWAVAIGLMALLAIATGLFFWQQRSSAAEPASIAVLPFRNLSSGDPFFAEGVGEEIIGQLAREPQFRIVGRTASEVLGKDPDVREVGRRLGVDYALAGSVRTQGDRVRVSANLLMTDDGTQVWASAYDGKLDDIFAIQHRIGSAIAEALRRKLIHRPTLSGPLVTRGDVYSLYLTARGLIRTRHRRMAPSAVALLRDAISIDPNYAPAWASLAEATQLNGALTDNERYALSINARAYARRAIQLAPNLAEAHRAYGELFGYGSPESLAHLRRAAELDPNNAENLVALGEALGATGEFERQLETYRQAHRLDPLWFRTVGTQAIALAEMGERTQAEALARREFRGNINQQNLLLGRIAWIFGDLSEAYRRWKMIVEAGSPRWSERVQISMGEAAFYAGFKAEPPANVPQPIWARRAWRPWLDEPSPGLWRDRNRDGIHAEVNRAENLISAKLMLNSGRITELARTYRSPTGLLGIRRGHRVRADQIDAAPIVALALRQAGENRESERILKEADFAVRRVYRQGRVPFWFDADSAAVFAAEERESEALAALERAVRRGWTHSGPGDLRDLKEEPAFRALHGQPRFERLLIRLANHLARERKELKPMLG